MINLKNLLFLICFVPFLSACTIDPPDPAFANSTVLFVHNTLDYSISVQCYYRPLDRQGLWCEQTAVAWSDRIEIKPNECILVMDYVNPDVIKIFNTQNGQLLNDEFGFDTNHRLYGMSKRDALQYDDESVARIGSLIIDNKYAQNGYYLKHDRYLSENVPWDIYPICLDQYVCTSSLIDEYDAMRKKQYKEQVDGYALVSCISLNPEAECFQ
ncbi:MAG: hypothetical protein EOL95_00525 [Bacteroidia bacterium]|nr:hypothetical protein [Bacteroidia bacterium]